MMTDYKKVAEILESQIVVLGEAFHTAEAKLADAQEQIKRDTEVNQAWIRSYNQINAKFDSLLEKLQEAEEEILRLKARVGISDIVRWQEAKEYIDFLEAELKEARNHKPTRPEWTKRVEL